MNDLIIDPNRDVNPESGYYDVSKLNIDVRLETIRKETTSLVASNSSTKIIGKVPNSVDFLSGNKVDKNVNINSLTTLFTEANNSFDIIENDNNYKDLETLGITEINIDFNSSNVPVVQLTMVDIRGRLFQNGNQSPFSVFFEIPYPIFKLSVRGFLGRTVTYDLHLVKFNSSFNSAYGGFEIKCEFIGHTYAFLSDMLIGYLRGVGYTKIGRELLKEDSIGGIHFDDLRQELKDLRTTVDNFATTTEQTKVDTISTVVNALMELDIRINRYFNETINGNKSITDNSYLLGSTTLLTFTKNDVMGEVEALKTFLNNEIEVFNEKYSEHKLKTLAEANNYDVIDTNFANVVIGLYDNKVSLISTNIHQRQDELPKILDNLTSLPIGKNSCRTITIEFILKEINSLTKKYQNELNEQRQLATTIFENHIQDAQLNLGIGYYFRVLCNHADVFMRSIAMVAQKAELDAERKSQFKSLDGLNHSLDSDSRKIMPFPEYKELDSSLNNNGTYVERWIGNIQADGKTIPEVEFIEDLIHGMIRAKQDELDDLALLEAPLGEQVISFTPIHPIDVLNVEKSYHPYANIENVKTIADLKKYVAYRSAMFLSTQNALTELPNEVLNDYAEIEVSNLNDILNKNELLKDILFNQSALMTSFINDGNITYRNILGKPNRYLAFSTLMQNGSYSNTIDILQNNTIDFNGDNKVVGENHVLIDQGDGVFVMGYPNLTEFKKLKSKPISLSVTDEKDNNTIVKPNSVLDDDNISYDKSTIIKAKFNTYKGYPYINMFNNKSTVYNFYKYDKSLTPNILYNRTTVAINVDNRSDSPNRMLFGSDLYRFQSSVESKALVFLLSTPLDLGESMTNNLGDNILSMFNQRSGVVKTSFLWCAWVGAIFKCIKNELRLKVVSQNKNIITVSDNNYDLINNEGYWKFKRSNGRIKLPYDSIEKYGVINTSINPLYEYPEFSQQLMNMHPDIINQFENKFTEFLNIFKTEIEPFDDVFISQMNSITYSTNLFDETVNNANYKVAIKNLFIKFKDGIFTNNENFEYKESNFKLDYEISSYFGGRNKHFYNAEIKSGSRLFNTIQELFNKYVNITNYNANFWADTTVVDSALTINYIASQQYFIGENGSFLTSNLERLNSVFIDKIKNADSRKRAEDIENLDQKSSLNMAVFGSDKSEDIKLKLYKDVKSIYDKWISGNSKYIGDNTNPLIDTFKFVNRTYEDIGVKFKINLFSIMKDLYGNFNHPLYAHISKVLSVNNFNFLPMPNYVDITSRGELLDMFTPRYYSDNDDTVKPTFLCMYVGEYSSKLDLGANANFRSDGIEMTIGDSLTQITASDFTNANNVPIIISRFGDSNQSIFKDFTITQSEYSITNESLVVVDDITKNNGLGQNLFDIYSLRSYTIKINCMGNAMLQPFMYFYLEGVPMFQGLYLITKVNHKIVPNSMDSEITAIRMRNTMTKMVDIESLYHSLFAEVSGTYNVGGGNNKTISFAGGGAINGQGYAFSGNSPFKNSINREINNSIGVTMNKAFSGGENFVLPEVHDFIYDVGKLWSEYANGKTVPQNITINYASLLYGGDTSKHSSHEMGTSLDIRPMVNSLQPETTTVTSNNYSKTHTRELIKIIQKVSQYQKYTNLYADKKVMYRIYFNDTDLINEFPNLVRKEDGHNNHLHIEIALPDKYKEFSINNGYKSDMDGSANMVSGYNIGDKIDYTSPYGFKNDPSYFFQWCGNVSDLSHGMDRPELKALLDVIAYSEGTMGRGKANGYDVLFGSVGTKLKCINGYNLNTTIKHRGLKGGASNGNGNWATYVKRANGESTPTGAAGRYQFMYGTWKDTNFAIDKSLNLTGKNTSNNEIYNKPFSKLNQDNACAWLVLDKLNINSPSNIRISNQTDLSNYLRRLSGTWEAFRHINDSDRPWLSMTKIYEIYRNALSKY